MGLNDSINNLITDIKSTGEYQTMVKTRTVIDKNINLKNRLSDFHKKQNDTFKTNLSNKEFDEKAKELDNIYNGLLKIKEIDEFMKASKKFDELIAKIYKNVSDSVYI